MGQVEVNVSSAILVVLAVLEAGSDIPNARASPNETLRRRDLAEEPEETSSDANDVIDWLRDEGWSTPMSLRPWGLGLLRCWAMELITNSFDLFHGTFGS